MNRENMKHMKETVIGLALAGVVACIGCLILIIVTPQPSVPMRIESYSLPVVEQTVQVHYESAPTLYDVEPTPEDLEAEQWCDSLEYLACCVEAEAGNQSELGKRLVCDTVLNRFDSGKCETLYDVINEPDQYSVVSNGSILRVIPTEETYRIVAEEVENRTNTEVLYFRTKHYHTFGTPLFKEDDHYFSKD